MRVSQLNYKVIFFLSLWYEITIFPNTFRHNPLQFHLTINMFNYDIQLIKTVTLIQMKTVKSQINCHFMIIKVG